MSDASKRADSDNKIGTPSSTHQFVGPSIQLFGNRLLINIGSWAFWIVISKFVSTSEIGEATAIYSLVTLTALFTQLGLEYPLLRLASSKPQILGTTLIIKLAVTLVSIPVMLYIITSSYGYPLQHEYVWIAILSVLASSVSFITRFTLLGIADAKNVLIFEGIATILKFITGLLLVYIGFGAFGILLSFLLYSLAAAVGTLFIVRRSFSFTIGDKMFFKYILKDGLTNTPSQLSRAIIIYLSVVLLAAFGVSSADVGIFYIAIMISIAAASLATSISFMVIPASSYSKRDLSINGLRIGLSLTAPVITMILVSPGSILSLISHEYSLGNNILLILGLGILPNIVAFNAISQFNNMERTKEIIIIGGMQLSVFLVAFYLLVPHYGTLGAAYSILVGSVASAILSVLWSGRVVARYILVSMLAIGIGWVIGEIITNYTDIPRLLGIIISGVASFVVIIATRNTSIREMKWIVKTVAGVGSDSKSPPQA